MKKILSFVAIVAMAVAVFCTTKSVNSSSNLQLSNLAKLNVANAECQPSDGIVHGRCLYGADMCVFDTEVFGCNPYAPN